MTVIPAGALIRNKEVPELGPGRVIAELEAGSVQVVFENSDEMNEVRLAHADIVRQPLIPGTLVDVQRGETVKQGEVIDVDWPESPRDLCAYTVRMGSDEDTVFESQVTPRPPASEDPRDHFGALHWRGPFRFFSRWDMHRMISGWYEDSEGLPTTIGARIMPQLHEAHAVREVLWDTQQRHFLADEDAQARLYEAAMIAQRMVASDPFLRVLVVAPGRRTHRWQTDLEHRFGKRPFMRVDATHLEVNPRERWASVSANERLVVSTGCLQQFPEACSELILSAAWDLVIFDDIHRLRADDPAYDCLVQASEQAEHALVLGALPQRPDAAELASMLALLRPEMYHPDDPSVLEDQLEQREALWLEIAGAEGVLDQLSDDDESADPGEFAAIADRVSELVGDDPFVEETIEQVKEGDKNALKELVSHLERHYRLERRVVRSRRERLAEFDVTWNERSVETIVYEADSSEKALVAHLDELPPESPTSALQLALRGVYFGAASTSPDRLFSVLEQRLDALDTSVGQAAQDLLPFDLLGLDAGPREEEMCRDQIIAGAPALDAEGEWIVEALSLVGQWHADAEVACARFEAAADWITKYLDQEHDTVDDGEDQPARRKVLVVCSSGQVAQDVSLFLETTREDEAVEVVHARMDVDAQNDAIERFRRDPGCRVLVCDDNGANGRDLSFASALVHLDQPWSPTRVERRISWVDQLHRSLETPVQSVVLVGPGQLEAKLHELYHDVLGIYEQSAYPFEYEMGQIDRDIWRAACAGPSALASVVDRAGEQRKRDQEPAERAYQVSFDSPAARLEDDADFADLLNFIDGVADSLPIRHWARMLGIQDHSAGPGVYDFKWHWKHVRRGLTGFDKGPEDVEFLMPQEQVEMMSGTFSRKRALRYENLEFFAPGHKFIDALVEDTLSPTDGRTSVFARRLGPENRGRIYLNVIALAKIDPGAWDGMYMPPGLINRAHRHLWPESVSAAVEIDLKGKREPRVVEDRELLQKLEQSYQGPEADQKIEYEVFIQTIEDVARFRDTLNQAVDIALDTLASDRAGLVQGAAAELADDLGSEMAFLRAESARDDDQRAGEADYELELLDKLIDGVRNEKLDMDALAIVVAGTPQILMR
jgi:ATP-dependent helicase HepA